MSISALENHRRIAPGELAAAFKEQARATSGTSFAGLLASKLAASGASARHIGEALELSLASSALDAFSGVPRDPAPLMLSLEQLKDQDGAAGQGGQRDFGQQQGTPPGPDTAALAEPVRSAAGVPASINDIVATAAKRYQVPEKLIHAVIRHESNYHVDAVSRVGAQGLMQLMPSTARDLGVKDSFDPSQNIMAGTRFLAELLDRYHGDTEKALAAYNWGPGNVDRRYERMPQETRQYVRNVMSSAA